MHIQLGIVGLRFFYITYFYIVGLRAKYPEDRENQTLGYDFEWIKKVSEQAPSLKSKLRFYNQANSKPRTRFSTLVYKYKTGICEA